MLQKPQKKTTTTKTVKMSVTGTGSKTHPNTKIFWDILVEGPNLLVLPSHSQLIFNVLTIKAASMTVKLNPPVLLVCDNINTADF